MVAHGQPHPVALTESAREARKSFYCDLCQKGYGRINEFEAHEGSYDHLHKKRLKEMKAMSRDPASAAKARKAEQKDSLITIKPLGTAAATTTTTTSAGGAQQKPGGRGFKKGAFRNAFGGKDEDEAKVEVEKKVVVVGGDEEKGGVGQGGTDAAVEGDGGESSDDDGLEEGERYDPRRPTGCWEGCEGRRMVSAG